MPTDHDHNTSGNASENPTPESQIPIIEGESQNTRDSHMRGSESGNQEPRKDKPRAIKITKIPTIKVIDDGVANTTAKKSNNISRISVVVNGLLLLSTAIIAYISYKQANSADNAAKIAEKTFEADTAYNNKIYRQSRIDAAANDRREDARDKRSETNLKIQNSSLRAQITYLDEVRRQFIKQNTPLLQVYIEKMIVSENKVSVLYTIVNQSGFARLISQKTAGMLYNKKPQFADTSFKSQEVSDRSITKETPYPLEATFNFNRPTFADTIKKRMAFLYWASKIEYEDVIDKKKRLFYFYVKIGYRQNGDTFAFYYANKNSDIK